MKLILGLLFAAISFLGCIFFRRYAGSVILYPSIWYFFFILLGLIGAFMVYQALSRANKFVNNEANRNLRSFKASAEKIIPNFDLCEFKSGSYYHEVADENVSSLNWVSPTGFQSNPTVTERVDSSTIVYQHSETERYIGSFPVDAVALKSYVLTGKLVLYVDRTDRSKYVFDLDKSRG